MSGKSRRDFLKKSAIIGAGVTGLSTSTTKAAPKNILSEDRMGVLVDTTVCVGCRNCEWACKDAHNLPAGDLEAYEDRKILEAKRRPDHTTLTVINEYSHGKNSNLLIDLKVQCMHCEKPAFISAYIVDAFTKHTDESVTWHSESLLDRYEDLILSEDEVGAYPLFYLTKEDIRKLDCPVLDGDLASFVTESIHDSCNPFCLIFH